MKRVIAVLVMCVALTALGAAQQLDKGTTPSGRTFFRGADILARDGSHTLSGRITEIFISDGEIAVDADLSQGIRNTFEADLNLPPIKHVFGLRHQSTQQKRGERGEKPALLFCFVDETPEWREGKDILGDEIPGHD